jgi:hypothetical protein
MASENFSMRTAYQDSAHIFATSNAPNSSAANASVSDDGRYVPLLMLVAVLAGAAIVMGLMAYREASIATMRVEGFTRALIAHGVKDTYPHIPGEDD